MPCARCSCAQLTLNNSQKPPNLSQSAKDLLKERTGCTRRCVSARRLGKAPCQARGAASSGMASTMRIVTRRDPVKKSQDYLPLLPKLVVAAVADVPCKRSQRWARLWIQLPAQHRCSWVCSASANLKQLAPNRYWFL